MKINSINNHQSFTGKPVFKNRKELMKYMDRTKTINKASNWCLGGAFASLAGFVGLFVATAMKKKVPFFSPETNAAMLTCFGFAFTSLGLLVKGSKRDWIAKEAKSTMGMNKKQSSRMSRHKKFELKEIYEQAVSLYRQKKSVGRKIITN